MIFKRESQSIPLRIDLIDDKNSKTTYKSICHIEVKKPGEKSDGDESDDEDDQNDDDEQDKDDDEDQDQGQGQAQGP